MKLPFRLQGLILALLLFSGTALAQAPVDPQIVQDKLTAFAVKSFSLGSLLTRAAEGNPDWPLNRYVKQVQPEQLACMRERLSPEGYAQSRSMVVRQFIARDPERAAKAARLLGRSDIDMDAALALANAFVAAGGEKAQESKEERTAQEGASDEGKEVALAVMAKSTPLQISAFLELTENPEYEGLLELANLPIGVAQSRLLTRRMMLDAMEHCKIPMSIIQQP